MPARNQKPADVEWVLSQNEFATGLYSGYLDKCKEVEEVFKTGDDNGGWRIPRDTADTTSPASPTILRPAKPRAIVDKFLTMLAVRADISFRVLPKKVGESEERACSLIENFLTGYWRQHQLETKTRAQRDFAYWGFLRGRACIETRFDPSYIGSDYMPIRTIVSDPTTIFPVYGENGIGWYTKAYQRYKWDVCSELEAKGEEPPGLEDVEDNDLVDIVEYWDKTWCAMLINEKLCWVKEHAYGFVPLAEARIRATPLASMDWAAQSVLYPILDTLKNQFILASKMATAVDVGFWPKVLAQSASGLTMIDTASTPPGMVENVSADAKLTVIPFQPNYQILNSLMAWLRGDEQLGGIPDIAWGSEPNSLESGFAISQVLSQVQDKIFDEKIAIEMALGWDASHKLKLIEKYAGRIAGAKMNVPVDPETYANYPRASRRPTMISLSADDIDGRHHVEVSITPDIPQERMVKSQLAAAYRAPGVDGQPLFDDITIRERVIEDDHPDQTARRIRQQMLASQSKVVQETMALAAESEWLDENKELVKLAEKRKEELANPTNEPTIPVSQVKQIVELMIKDAMSGGGSLQQAIATQDAVDSGQLPPDGMLPTSVQPPQPQGGPPPEVMPSQMSMQPADVLPIQADVQAMQQRRLRPQNGQ